MGRFTEGSDAKSQLVAYICNISKRPISCVHLRRRNPVIRSHFIDWYLLLQVEENVGIDVIKKQYHKYALLLHPDKNKHPKAEIAFKLVYEAYACLKDNTRRAAFDLERQNSFCRECSKLPNMSKLKSPSKSATTKLRALFTKERSKPNKIFQGMNDIKARFKEEAGIIEKCLKMNAATKTEESTNYAAFGKEIPVFNPSDYMSEGYPHFRTRKYTKSENLWCLYTGKMYTWRKEKRDSPVFESRPVKVSPVCLSSY